MTHTASVESMKEHIPGELLRERRARAPDDIHVEIHAHAPVQEPVVVPAVPEPMLVWIVSGAATVEERPLGGEWLAVPVRSGDFYLTTSPAPVEMRWRSTGDEPFCVMHVYLGLPLLARTARELAGKELARFALREVSGERDAVLGGLFQALHAALSGPVPAAASFVQGVAQAITAHVVAHYERETDGRAVVRGGLPAHKLRRVLDAMRDGLAEPFDLGRLAALAGLSVFHFSRVFKQATGMAPSRYFVRLRMDEARRLLGDTRQSMLDIGLAVGYASPSHFAQVFRESTGTAPSAWRAARQPGP
ncbi:helix-turn-helix domain-containing protein [Massilia dura]|uniref:Helix-turn-helix domain-containing protein n=1 Tax=Pseudoduganella dura TaxID=321982 RepID=A0A6I3X4P1_9BURK|nr:helix-turn-helix domain-containing protein [Pseudoduganella dura]MUI11684.1 helix-turn-helix domain-containing protein [Pseudoduganella dura]GGX78326.1 AraC family transcriptional regulator [Pseudoduganella dura]